MLAVNPRAVYYGVDVSEAGLAAASKNLPQAVFLKTADGEKLPLPSDSIDVVFASEVLEHIYDTENAFSEIARVLKPNGLLLITVPYHGLIKNLLIVLFAFDAHFSPTGAHIRFFSKRSLLSCLKRSHMAPLKAGYLGRFFPVPCSIFVLARKRISG